MPKLVQERVLAYNPDLLSKTEIINQFMVRNRFIERLVDDLKAPQPQAKWIVGSRGMGKTMLLHRLAYAIEDDLDLPQHWLALTFPEAQYQIACLADFFVSCILALKNALDRDGKSNFTGEIDSFLNCSLDCSNELRIERCKQFLLAQTNQLNLGFFLLVDNAEKILDRLDDREKWTLRELLSQQGDKLVFIGTSTVPWGPSVDYASAFYNFFQLEELEGFSETEAYEVMNHFASLRPGSHQLKKWLNNAPQQLEILRTLSNGNPRTLVLLFNLLLQGIEEKIGSNLDRLLDVLTPVYQAKMEILSPQAQQILTTLALNWNPMTSGDLASHFRLESSHTSSQLIRLKKMGLIEQVKYFPDTKVAYQITERFFNIWFLMRASRKIQQKLAWFVEFLLFVPIENAVDPIPLDVDPIHLNAQEQKARRSIALNANNLQSILDLAIILAQKDSWKESWKYARQFFLVCQPTAYKELWAGIIGFFRQSVEKNRTTQTIDLLHECGLEEKWIPIFEALNAIKEGTSSYLHRVAPEIREPAMRILYKLKPEIIGNESKIRNQRTLSRVMR